uniref:Mitochondrial import receptor subunit TOM40 homolog n=1 Tax=Syphacia muris TaxID=451379 RepID=A0A0N5B078_9BILA
MSAAPEKSVASGVTVENAAEKSVPFVATTSDNNPGSFDELHRKCRDIFPMCFEGAKVMVQKGLSTHFQVTHTLSISPLSTGYRFGATYVGNTMYSPTDAFPVVLGDTDAAGNTSATFLHQWGKFRVKLQSQVQNSKLSAAQGTFEYRGRLSTLGLTLANIDVISESGIIVGQLLRRLTPKFDLGAELVYQYGKQMPGQQISMLTYAARYNGKNFTASGTIGKSGLHLCYYHKQHENLAFGVEFESNFRVKEALTTFAYQAHFYAELPDEGVTMRASVDTNWTVIGVFEKKLNPSLPFTLALSGMLNHVKAQGRFGIGLIIG